LRRALTRGLPMSRDSAQLDSWPHPANPSFIASNARSKAAIRSRVTCASAVANFRYTETVGTVNTRA